MFKTPNMTGFGSSVASASHTWMLITDLYIFIQVFDVIDPASSNVFITSVKEVMFSPNNRN